MPTPTVTPVVAGIDVGKSSLDAHVLPLDRHRSFANDKCGRSYPRKSRKPASKWKSSNKPAETKTKQATHAA